MVNGILRSFCRAQENLPQPDDLATRYSHPQWLVDLLSQAVPAAELESLLASNNAEPPTTIQTNTTKITPDALAETLAAQGVTVETHPWLDGCFTLRGTGDLEQLKAFRDGLFLVQDTASRLVVLAAQPEAGQHILDACGAPGGKSFSTAIAIGDDGSILSCDIHPSKVKQIQKGAKRLGLASIQSQIRNAKEYDPSLDEQFDLVLADAPCSGLGIIRKKPDIRNKDPEPLKDLPRIQGDILENVSRYVKSGGVLVYSTCTVLERENQDVVRGFLAKHPEFTLEPFTLPDAIGTVEEGMLTLWPHIHGTDGFFLSKMRKQGT
ncbi:MAG: 16S rRNA (cytosine(967)-C(5))-methyltransferase RsmB [Oscillospiraceae bacterium]